MLRCRANANGSFGITPLESANTATVRSTRKPSVTSTGSVSETFGWPEEPRYNRKGITMHNYKVRPVRCWFCMGQMYYPEDSRHVDEVVVEAVHRMEAKVDSFYAHETCWNDAIRPKEKTDPVAELCDSLTEIHRKHEKTVDTATTLA